MAFLRDLAPVAICAMNEYPKCSDDGWRQLQSIQADGTEAMANPIKLSVTTMLEVML